MVWSLCRAGFIALFALWIVGLSYGATKKISFQTADGWTIHGTLHLPPKALNSGASVPGVVLLHSPGYDQSSYYPLAAMLESKGMAALRIDWRGNGKSMRKANVNRPFASFTQEEREKIYWDVKGAVEFLAAQEGVDARRIGVVASRLTTNAALLQAVSDWRVRAFVSLSAMLDQKAIDAIPAGEHFPILFVVSKEDQRGFQDTAQAYRVAKHKESDLWVYEGGGYGTTMFSQVQGLDEKLVQWLADKLKGLGWEKEVSFQTEDGWTIHGTLHLPDDLDENEKLPGVVLTHGGRHDSQAFHHLAPLLVKKRLAALRIDWRGRGKSFLKDGREYEYDTMREERDKVHLDIKAAIDFLAGQRQVDVNRIGLVSASFSTNQALIAASGDLRLRAIVLVTSYVLSQKAKDYLSSAGSAPVLAIASKEDSNLAVGSLAEFTTQAYELSTHRDSKLVMYEGVGRGTEMFHVKDEIEPMIAEWIENQLYRP